MFCPKCNKAEVKEMVIYEGIIFRRIKKVITYCSLCQFKNEHIFKINEDTYRDRK